MGILALGRTCHWIILSFSLLYSFSIIYCVNGLVEVKKEEEYRFVTAFYDIGRGQWGDKYARSTETYFERFLLLLNMNLPLVVFIDDRYLSRTIELIRAVEQSRSGELLQIELVPMNDQFLADHIQSWGYVPIESEIMSSESYITMAARRNEKGTPETLYPQYTCINHAKVDFISYYIDTYASSSLSHIGWVDFGYFTEKFEVVPFKLSKELLFNDHVNFIAHGDILEEESDPSHVFTNVPIKIHGAFWFGSITAVQRYKNVYHQCVLEMHDKRIADDDQTVALCCYFKEKGLMKLWKNETWATLDGVVQLLWYIAFYMFNAFATHEEVVIKFMRDNGV